MVFNIKGNDYRLLVAVNFLKGEAYIIWFGTHKEYDKVDVTIQRFDIDILKLKDK